MEVDELGSYYWMVVHLRKANHNIWWILWRIGPSYFPRLRRGQELYCSLVMWLILSLTE